MGVVQNSIDIQKIIEAGGDPTIAAKVAELEAEIGDENSGIIKDIDDLQEANALIMTSVSAVKTTADSAKARADQAVLWSERKGYVGKNALVYPYYTTIPATIASVSVTEGEKGCLTFNGTSDNTNGVFYIQQNMTTEAGSYILTKGTTNEHIFVVVEAYDNSTWVKPIANEYTPDGSTIVIDYEGYNNIRVSVRTTKNTVYDNVTVKPMLRLASIADEIYEPYLPNNNELLRTATLKSVTADAADFTAFKTAIAAL